MDRLFIVFFIAAVAVVAVAITFFPPQTQITYATTTSTTSTSTSTTSTTSTSTTLQGVTTTPTTTTTLPRYVEVGYSHLGRCGTARVGKIQELLVNTTGRVTGVWTDPPGFKIVCDDVEMQDPYRVAYRGGGLVPPGSPVEGVYGLDVRCGRTQPIEDLEDCRNLDILVDTTTLGEEYVPPSSTTTTLAVNPYLERFMGQGYRRVDMKISWLCTSCVPATNNLVINEPGVKSRSLMYRQEINYVIYDPNVVSLERVLELAGSGGDIEVIDDYGI